MSGCGKGVSSAVAISNAITNLYGMVFILILFFFIMVLVGPVLIKSSSAIYLVTKSLPIWDKTSSLICYLNMCLTRTIPICTRTEYLDNGYPLDLNFLVPFFSLFKQLIEKRGKK